MQLYLNNQLCDLSDDNPIALTFQINSLADVKNQAGNTSNQFKLPLTQNNRRILGYPDDIRVTDGTPYTQLRARLIQDGIEVIPEGLGVITDADDNNASVTIVSGNFDFFDAISGQIYDMGDITTDVGKMQLFLPYQHTWDLNTVVNSRTKTDGYIYPIINYGNLNPLQPYSVDVRNLRPAFFLKTAIDLIIKQTGYKSQGSLLSNPLYPKLIIPFANDSFEHGADYENQPDEIGMLAQSTSDKTVDHKEITNSIGNIPFQQTQSDPKGQYNGTSFIAQEVFTAEILVTIPNFYLRGRLQTGYDSNVEINIHLDTPSEGSLDVATLLYDFSEGYTRVDGTSGGSLQGYTNITNKKVSAEVNMKPGYTITVQYHFLGGRPSYFNLYAGASLSIKADNKNVLFGQQVQCERIFPDISQKDLLKDNLQRFGIICQTDNTNRTVTFATFKDIVRNVPIAKKWTAKCVNQGKNNSFILGDYAQVNNLKYKQDDAIVNGYADDVIRIDNKNLPATVDLFTSQFAPSLNSPYVRGYTAEILKIDTESESTDFSIGTQPRILIDEKVSLQNDVSSLSVTFTDGTNNVVVNDIISMPYFHKLNGQFSLMWQDMDGQPGLRSLYYKELERILTRTKKVVRYFLLTPADITELDLLIPVYLEQDNAYFYINKVDSWRKGQAIKVELIKLGEI